MRVPDQAASTDRQARSEALALPPDLAATIVLVRHGESTYIAEGRFQGRQDPPLSALGERQAALVAARLADPSADPPLPLPAGPPIGLWHSPLRRAAATARVIADARPDRLPLHAAEGLIEIGQGEWEGLPAAEVSSRWPAELAAWRSTPTTNHAPGGESLADAGGRVGRALAEILAALDEHAGANRPLRFNLVPGYQPAVTDGPLPVLPWALLVAHDGIFRLALMSLLGLPHDRFWAFPFTLCAISVIDVRAGRALLRAHNLADHLAPIGAEARAQAEARGERRGAL
jgi:broad specificity phosphatase PhoE